MVLGFVQRCGVGYSATGDGLPQVNGAQISTERNVFGLVRKALDAVDVGANPVRHGCFGWGFCSCGGD